MDETTRMIAACRNKDRAAQQKLYDLYARKMMGVCLRYVGDRETARDLLQEGFIKVFAAIGTYVHTGTLEAWMRRIFANCALEYLRKKDVLRDSIEIGYGTDTDNGDVGVVAKLAADDLVALIGRLPTGARSIFNLYAVEGYSHKEIAGMFGITESTSRSQYVRARQWLQQQLKKMD